jgi:hypothetical protein
VLAEAPRVDILVDYGRLGNRRTRVICDLRTAWTFADGHLQPDRVEVAGDRGGAELVVGQALDVYAEGHRTSYPAVEGMILCATNRIIFWRTSAIALRRQRSSCRKRSSE